MNYLFIAPIVIRGELESLSSPLDNFKIIDDSGPKRTPGNRHSIILWNKIEFNSDEEAIEYVKELNGNWRYSLNFDSYLRDGYIKTGHLMLHSIEKDSSIWSENEDIDYVFDGVKSRNKEYKEYGIIS